MHIQATSKLSRKLLISLGIFLLVLTVLALTRLDREFQFGNLLILFATFLQAFLILHFVHWRWHKFDLSFDAIVKFFSSGFLLGTSSAIFYECLVSIVFGIISFIVIIINMSEEMGDKVADDQKEYVIHYLKSHVWLFVIMAFFRAFVIAALVEELCKYFAFWMVEHPDFMDEEDWNVIPHEPDSELGTEAKGISPCSEVQPLVENAQEMTLKSKGTAITIAMVTASLGFACCENLIYVFTGTPGASIGMGE